MGRTKGVTFTMESWMIVNGKPGKIFYSDKMDRHLSAIAANHKRKIKTERMLVLTTGGKKPRAAHITKVYLL